VSLPMSFFVQQLLNGLMFGCTYALVGIGFNLIFGVMKLINLAHGQIIMAGAFIALALIVYYDVPLLLASLCAAVACGGIGLVIERICVRPVRHNDYMASLLTTIGAGIILQEVFIKLFSTEDRLFPTAFEFAQLKLAGFTLRVPYLITLAVSLVLMLGLHAWITRTRAGRAVRAMSENADAARLMGVNVDRLTCLTFALASAIGGIAGVLIAVSSSIISTTMGGEMLLKGFVVIILGGLGSIPGAALGGVLLGLVEVVTVAYLPSLYRDFFSFGLLMLMLICRPAGLLGVRLAERA
jgi:branched-chain amino acid transport system permease protein